MKLYLVLSLTFLNLTIYAQSIFLIQGEEKALYPGYKVEYLEDKAGKLTFEEVQKKSFTKNNAEHLNLGYSESVFWIRLRIQNNTEYNDWRLVNFVVYHNFLDVWIEQENNTWKHIKTGWRYPFKSRENFDDTGFVFPLKFQKNKPKTIYFRLKSIDPLTFPLELMRKENLTKRVQAKHIFYGFYFGVLLVMLFYNLFIWFVLQDKNYIFYVLSILFTFIIFSSVNGYPFKYIYPNIPEINTHLTRIAMGFVTIFTALFAINFLEVKKYNLWLYRLFLLDIILAFPAIILSVSIYPPAVNKLLSLHSPLLLIGGIIVWIKGNKTASFYVFAWVFYLLGAAMITLRNSGNLPVNFITTHAVEVGSALEVVLLSLALAQRYRILRKEKEIATKRALQIQKEANESLESKVEERTLQLKDRNEELHQINEELDITLHALEIQKKEVEIQNEQISDSINYAQRIQNAILPSENIFKSSFQDFFVFYKPRDVVSGDFYFIKKQEEKTILALADCTGHGVPGAFMSMMGVNLLERVFAEEENISSQKALQKVDEYLAQTLSAQESEIRDGMDAGICIIDRSKQKMCFSGAGHALLKVKNAEVTIYKKGVQAIGGSKRINLDLLPSHEITFQKGERFFLYSDGYQDQFGGELGKKFMRKRFRELLINTSHLSCEKQKNILDNTLQQWIQQAKEKQTDDVLVIGFEIL